MVVKKLYFKKYQQGQLNKNCVQAPRSIEESCEQKCPVLIEEVSSIFVGS